VVLLLLSICEATHPNISLCWSYWLVLQVAIVLCVMCAFLNNPFLPCKLTGLYNSYIFVESVWYVLLYYDESMLKVIFICSYIFALSLGGNSITCFILVFMFTHMLPYVKFINHFHKALVDRRIRHRYLELNSGYESRTCERIYEFPTQTKGCLNSSHNESYHHHTTQIIATSYTSYNTRYIWKSTNLDYRRWIYVRRK
jgi:hypothetical protein